MSPRFVKLSRRSAEVFARMSFDTGDREECAAVAEVRVALAPKPLKRHVRKARTEKAKKDKTKRTKTSAVYRLVSERAGMVCECGCGRWFRGVGGRKHMDHFWGKARAESLDTCWMLRAECHAAKHAGTRKVWLQRFLRHAEHHNYDDQILEAQKTLEAEELKAQQAFAVGKAANNE